MSLAKKIIYGSSNDVAEFLKTKPDLDIIDEYGYTPLIQATIVDSLSKAQLLLAAGAHIDFPDLTGRTALFWAADNNNLELCQLYLKHQANPNAYSAGGQPALVMPLMKKQQEIKQLLIAAGANLDFAQDFLTAKLIGHSFELEGRVDIVDPHQVFIEVELEGFYLRFTLEIIATSLIDFRKSFAAKKMQQYFTSLDKIIYALQGAISLLQFQHYLIDVKQFLNKINLLLENDPLILPIAFGGHAITLIKYGDNIIRCDRGAYGKNNSSVIYYKSHHPSRLTKAFYRELLYKRQYPEFINSGLIEYLGLQPLNTLNLPLQKTGNCSWANVEAIIPALMLPILSEEQKNNKTPAYKRDALYFYAAWQEWNKTRSLDFCLQTLKTIEPTRRAAKASLLAAILFQACDQQKPQDRTKANKILSILSQPENIQVLKCYVKTFNKEQDNELWQNFSNYLENYGIDIEKLLV